MYLWGSHTPCPNIAFSNKLDLNEHFFRDDPQNVTIYPNGQNVSTDPDS